VACALALLKVAARHKLELRVGLAVGPVFAGPLGAPQRREYSVIGDTVNLAARLMQKAQPGQVWLDHSVQSKAEKVFEYKDLGLIQVKGKTKPRRVYQALGEKDQEELVIGYLLSSQELTGRNKELALIDQLTQEVWSGRGQVLLLSGEAGVGKSRLAAEIMRRWLSQGGVSHGGDCLSYGRQTPYLPWRGILSSIAGLSPRLPVTERLARLERLLHHLPLPASRVRTADSPSLTDGYWLERLPLLADILGLEAEETELTCSLAEDLRRDNVFATIRAVILQEARQRPTLILLEDVHWSDELSLELAAYLAADIIDYPLFLMLVHRPLSDPLPLAYRRIKDMSYSKALLVDELDIEAGLKLVKRKLGVKSLPQSLADLISQKGQGNPFFIEELVNSLLTMGVIQIEDEQCKIVGNLQELEMPDTVQKVVLARIDRLPETEKVTLKIAAVIGRTFQRDLLEAVHPWLTSEVSLTDQLARLQAEDFTRQEVKESDLDFLFKHVITQEVTYETMLYSQRRQLHATIGDVLEKRYLHNDSEIVDLLAFHYTRSGNRHKALYYLQRAGQKALDGYANEAAISYLSEALTAAQELDIKNARYELLAGREQAYSRVGNRSAQAQGLEQMTNLALAEGDLNRQLETGLRRLQLATDLGDYDQAIATAEENLALARDGDFPLWEARTLTHLGIAYWRHGCYDDARRAMEQSLDIKRAANDARLKATNLNYLGLIYNRISEYQKAREAYQKAIEIYRSVGDRGGEAGCANNLGLLEASLGCYEQARHYYSQALSICHTIGDRLREGISLNTLGQVLTVLGDYERAGELLERSLGIRRAIGDRRGEAFCLHDMGYLHLAKGQTAEAIHHFRTAAQLRQELGETGNYIASWAALGEASLAADDLDTAYQCLQEAAAHLQRGGGSGEYPPQNIWWTYARVCRLHGKDDEANRALSEAVKLVQSKADHIREPELKRSYLENIQVNAAILTENYSA
jgi:predicted ATPase